MTVIHADHERRYDISGVPGTARKPVDIDAAKTGFTRLRSLRVYRFEAGAPVDGHAEEDEVFVVVTAGSATMKIGWEDSAPDAVGEFDLAAPWEGGSALCAVYLPPHAAYELKPHTTVDVAYARATPNETRQPAVFAPSNAVAVENGVTVLLCELKHAQHLRIEVACINAAQGEVRYEPLRSMESSGESLVHVQGTPVENLCGVASGNSTVSLASWDTVAFTRGEQVSLQVPHGAQLSILTVSGI